MFLLTIAVAILFLTIWWQDFKVSYSKYKGIVQFSRSYKFRETLYFILIISLPLLFVNLSDLGGFLNASESALVVSSVIISFSISIIWYLFLYRLDFFEREPILIILLTFILGAAFTFFVFPIANFVNSNLHFYLNGEIWNDWWYCVFGIGMVEEIVKIIPFLIVLKFTKFVNEPFDYIVYGSVSALGFAFIENVMYLNSSHLTAIYGRAMFSSVAHMVFTSIITYGLIYLKHSKIDLKGFQFPILLLLASLAHGFYDFWLINDAMNSFYYLTILFYLLSIYLWATMINNLLNISPYYILTEQFNRARLKYRIVNLLITVIYFAYIMGFLLYGKGMANNLLFHSWQLNVFTLLFLAFNLSNMEFVKGYIGRVKFKNGFGFLLPRIHSNDNHAGKRVRIFIHEKMQMRNKREALRALFPIDTTLLRRISFKGNTDCYLIKSDHSLNINKLLSDHFVLKLISKEEIILGIEPRPMVVYGLKNHPKFEMGVIPDREIIFLHEVEGYEIL